MTSPIYERIPKHMMTSLNDYINEGKPVGGFLTCVLSNDLFGAVAEADHVNVQLIPLYVQYIHWEAPMNCHGSLEKMEKYYKEKETNKKIREFKYDSFSKD